MGTKCLTGFLLLVGLPGAAVAQGSGAARWLEEINRDIWVPFLDGVARNVDTLYLDVHSRDYVRIQEQGRLILSYDTYVDDTRTMMQQYHASGTRITMQVRFQERITNGQFASERGISRIVFATPNSEPRVFYGRFHAVSRREGGRWKILSDFAAAGGEPPGEAEFLGAHDMNDVTPFRCYMRYPEKKTDCGG
jgi:hypothetical protein